MRFFVTFCRAPSTEQQGDEANGTSAERGRRGERKERAGRVVIREHESCEKVQLEVLLDGKYVFNVFLHSRTKNRPFLPFFKPPPFLSPFLDG